MLQRNAPSMPSLHVLVANDTQVGRAAITDLLKSEPALCVEEVSGQGDLLARLAQGDIDCIIIERMLGAESGFAIRDLILGEYRYPPAMIMATASGDENAAVKAFRCGFDNYFSTKNLRPKSLLSAIAEAVDHRRADKLQRDELELLADLAVRDRATGLSNRTFLDERLAMLFAGAERRARHYEKRRVCNFAILLIDITGFGEINQSFGHAVGDAALRAFADRLQKAARKSDYLGRFGDDEFLYIIEGDVSIEAIEQTCRRLVEELAFSVELESVGLSLSCTIGAAICPGDGTTAAQLIDSAKLASQAAKEEDGRYRLALVSHGEAEAAAVGDVVGSQNEGTTGRRGISLEITLSDGTGSATNGHADVHREKDRRSERRHRVLKRGVIVSNGGFSTVDCVVRDLSPGGARIAVDTDYVPHAQFSLVISETGEKIAAEKRWQRGREIGVKFIF